MNDNYSEDLQRKWQVGDTCRWERRTSEKKTYYYTSPSINTKNLEIVILVNIYGYMFRLILS